MSRNATLYGKVLAFALRRRVERRNTASRVLRFFRKPNCSCPIKPFFSAASVICLHILTVSSLRMLEGMVIGRYWDGCSASPPWKGESFKSSWLFLMFSDYTLNTNIHLPLFSSTGTSPSRMILFRKLWR